MKARSCRLTVEALEDRYVPSTVAYADFNNDGLLDMAAVTNSTTITVSLANPDGSYTVSAILTAPKSQSIGGVNVGDYNGDGNLDISSGGAAANHFYTHTWLGNGDGTFDARNTQRSSNLRWWV
jgi:VCBS repeat protein